jgi:hypothetical protein
MIAPNESINEEPIRLDGLDNCIIGTDVRGYLIYDYGKLLNHFVKEGMDEGDAMEWVDYNIMGMAQQNFIILFDDFDLEVTVE